MKLLNLCLLAFLPVAFATNYNAPFELYPEYETDVYACQELVASLGTFCDANVTDSYSCTCMNAEAIATFAGCILDNAPKAYDSAAAFAENYCTTVYLIPLTSDDFAAGLAYYEASAVDYNDSASYVNATTGLFTVPIKFDKDTSELYLSTYLQFMNNYNNSAYYSFILIGYWLFVLFIYSLGNWSKLLFPSFFVRSKETAIWKAVKRYIITPATWGSRKQEPFGSATRLGGVLQILVPSRLETYILIVFLGLCLAFLGVNMQYTTGDPTLGVKSYALERYLGDRSGILGTITIPLLILFSGRNNFLQWITGVNFATFITFHKWMGRVFMIMIIIHSAVYTLMMKYDGDYAEEMAQEYLVWGTVGTVAGSLILIQSFLLLRRKWYEIFLTVHIILAVLFIVGTWKHIDDLGYDWFMYIAVGFWAVDRIMRVAKLIIFGFPVVDIKLINGDLVKISVPQNKLWKPVHGGYAFVYFWQFKKLFQSHPYTYVQFNNQINFYIKVKQGITQKLQKELLSLPEQTTRMRISVEGPYGGGLESHNVKNYNRAVFLAGGNGIPGLFSDALHLGSNPDSQQQIKLIWVNRDYNALNWFWDELMALQGTKTEVDVYITRPETELIGYVASLDETDEEGSKKEKDSGSEEDKHSTIGQQIQNIQNSFPHINFIHSKPSMEHLVKSEVEVAGLSAAFVVCGHPKMVDEVRQEVSKADQNTRVDFYELLQVWA